MLKALPYQLRVGALFLLFGFICMLGNLLFLPVFILGLHRRKVVQNLARDCVYFSWRAFLFFTSISAYERHKFNLKSKVLSSTLIIANHPSLLDVVFLLSHFRRANCVVKAGLCKNPFLLGAIKACGYIPNTQNEELLSLAKDALNSGETLIIFPEGTRSKGEIVFHKAASYIAVNAALNLIQIAIKMQPISLRKGEPWYVVPTQRIEYEFKELEKIDILCYERDRLNPARARLLHKQIEQIYKAEFKE